MPMLTDDTILMGTPHCVLREQEDGYVVYNSRSDELHMIPILGHYLYRLCDGLNDIGSICRVFSVNTGDDGAEARTQITAYFEKLVARGILHEVRHG